MESKKSELMNDVELIAYLGIDMKPSTVEASRTSGMLGSAEAPPHIKIMRQSRYRLQDIDQWIDGQESKVTNAEHNIHVN